MLHLLPALSSRMRIPAMLFGAAFVGVLYQLPLQIHLFAPVKLEPLAIDRAIPFVDWTIWLYCSYYLFLFVPFLFCRSDVEAARVLYALMAAAIIGALIFFAWPTSGELQSPSLEGPTGVLWRLLLAADRPGNYFPSLHVANASIIGRCLTRENRFWRWAAPAWAFAIIVSTVTTKQHFFIDIPAGIALGWFSVQLVNKGLRIGRTALAR